MTVAIPLALFTVVMLLIGFAWGAICVALARGSELRSEVAFGWGAALGPVGLCVVAVISRRRRSAFTGPTGGGV